MKTQQLFICWNFNRKHTDVFFSYSILCLKNLLNATYRAFKSWKALYENIMQFASPSLWIWISFSVLDFMLLLTPPITWCWWPIIFRTRCKTSALMKHNNVKATTAALRDRRCYGVSVSTTVHTYFTRDAFLCKYFLAAVVLCLFL